MGESVVFTFVAIALSLVIVELLLPFFNNTFNVNLDLDFINNPIFNVGLIALLLLVSIFSGSYPAFYLSRFQPVKVLKGGTDRKMGSSGNLSKVLVVFQFIISIALIISVAVTYSQFQYSLNKDMGFNYNNVLNITTYNIPSEKIETLKNDLRQNPHILDMCEASFINGVSGSQNTLRVNDSAGTPITCRVGVVDYDYFNMMEIPIVLGRNFDESFSTDENQALILNQAAVDYFGWENPLDHSFQAFWSDTTLPRQVVGVIRDYHYYSLHSKIEPAAYIVHPPMFNALLLKVDAGKTQKTVDFVQDTWTEHLPGIPFDAKFAGQLLKEQYSDDADNVKNVQFLLLYFQFWFPVWDYMA